MKAFLFDVDDTLYDQVQPFAQTLMKILGKTLVEFSQNLLKNERLRGKMISVRNN
ncbi:hypothetical protein [uncultured Eubacterium sp.]|uniref:hypothetical protein n=1 Tax=uncultured Eubacterium sp. TaxID=165185 RepID=UPI0025E74B8B|nr:hypothetical protein [uncultured Eubacterium sp.]